MTTLYACHRCGVHRDVDLIDGYTGLCPDCRDKPARIGAPNRACEVCGVAIAGHSNRRTCSVRCRVALHRRNRKAA
jgi:hypothetical protein